MQHIKSGRERDALVFAVAARYIRCMHVEPGPHTGTYILSNTIKPPREGQMEICATKHDANKCRLELLPFEALNEVGWVMTFGATKYSPNDWRKGLAVPRVLGAALRHLFAYLTGEKLDPESGRSHLAHAVCMILFALTFDLEERDGKAE